MVVSNRGIDRRIQRTRQALLQAFSVIAREKGFAATSIRDITEQANVNRGTFYLHFTDKYMLADELIRENFRLMLNSTLPPTSRWDKKTLYLLIEALLSYFEAKYKHQPLTMSDVAPLIEQAIHEELNELLLTWLKKSETNAAQWLVPRETISRVVSWAIFGTVIQWSQEEISITREQIAHDIMLVIVEGMVHLAPGILPG